MVSYDQGKMFRSAGKKYCGASCAITIQVSTGVLYQLTNNMLPYDCKNSSFLLVEVERGQLIVLLRKDAQTLYT